MKTNFDIDITKVNNAETIIKEMYWVANYNDGTKLMQYEGQKENKYADIDRERLERFDMIDMATNKPVYALYLREGQRLIYRRRTEGKFDGSPRIVTYLVGYQHTVMTNSGAKNFVVLNYLHADGSVALDGHRDNLQILDLEQ